MANRSAVAAAYLLVIACGPAPAPQPEATPVATTLAPNLPPESTAAAPTLGAMPTPASPPSADTLPAASPATAPTAPASASASGEPSPAPPDPARKALEERLRSELAAVKARADALSAASAAECPDLKPGELRHPGAVARCARLRSEAAQAVSQYEAMKKQAEAAGLAVQ